MPPDSALLTLIFTANTKLQADLKQLTTTLRQLFEKGGPINMSGFSSIFYSDLSELIIRTCDPSL